MDEKYDVAFSFAGEQRDYVQEVYENLEPIGISVFYDAAQIANLWGKDLYEYLSDVYQNKADYCVVFLSNDYAKKLWTKHELKCMQARAFQESREYILPARFDNTEIPGLLPTIAYIELANYTPKQFAVLITEKVKEENIQPEVKFDPELETHLAEAVIWVEDYLRPQSLDLSDAIATSVRSSFRDMGLKPERHHLIPYINNPRAAYRVVGYFAFQIDPPKGMVMDLIHALGLEKKEASEHKETRPLWQLLVCFTYLLQYQTPPADRDLIKEALIDFFDFLRRNPTIDPGGECKQRIEMLVGERWLYEA